MSSRSGPVDHIAIDLAGLQELVQQTFGGRHRNRDATATLAELAERMGALGHAVRAGSTAEQARLFGDLIISMTMLANQQHVDLDAAVARYSRGCPDCGLRPCAC